MKRILLYITLPFILAGCIEEDEFANTPRGNFEALWSIMDEHYCFFPEAEEEFGLDWNAVYEKYRPIVNETESEALLFDVLGDMIAELRDGHVNLSSIYGTKFYWDWKLDYPKNFSDSIQRNYLGHDFRITNGIKYTALPDSIGYVYVESFASGFSADNLSVMLMNLKHTKGIVLDIRDNGGGMLTAAERLASHFTKEKIHCGYIQHKTGKGQVTHALAVEHHEHILPHVLQLLCRILIVTLAYVTHHTLQMGVEVADVRAYARIYQQHTVVLVEAYHRQLIDAVIQHHPLSVQRHLFHTSIREIGVENIGTNK